MVKESKGQDYLGDIMDICSEDLIKRHNNYNYPVSSRGSDHGDGKNLLVDDMGSPISSPTSTRPPTNASSKAPPLTPRQFLDVVTFNAMEIPSLEDAMDQATRNQLQEVYFNFYPRASRGECPRVVQKFRRTAP